MHYCAYEYWTCAAGKTGSLDYCTGENWYNAQGALVSRTSFSRCICKNVQLVLVHQFSRYTIPLDRIFKVRECHVRLFACANVKVVLVLSCIVPVFTCTLVHCTIFSRCSTATYEFFQQQHTVTVLHSAIQIASLKHTDVSQWKFP